MRNLFCFLLLLIGTGASGQGWFSKHNQGEPVAGYIVTIAGDTIKGVIKYDYPVVMQKRVSFTREGTTDGVIFQSKDIRGYSCEDMQWVSTNVTIKTYKGPVNFQRFGILYSGKGPLELLRIFPEKDKTIKKMSSSKAETMGNNIGLSQTPNSFKNLYIKKLEDPAEDVTSSTYKKQFIQKMARLVSDDKDLMDKINNKVYKYKNLPEIVNEYNQWYLNKKFSR